MLLRYILPILITLFVVGLSVYLFFKIKKWITYAIDKSIELTTEQQERWRKQAEYKKLPEHMQKGISHYENTQKIIETLPQEWSQPLQTLANQAEAIISLSAVKPEKAERIRQFFTVTLSTWDNFVTALENNQQDMDSKTIQKAQESLKVFEKDFQHYQNKLQNVHRFDFDVMMDVVKQRLKK